MAQSEVERAGRKVRRKRVKAGAIEGSDRRERQRKVVIDIEKMPLEETSRRQRQPSLRLATTPTPLRVFRTPRLPHVPSPSLGGRLRHSLLRSLPRPRRAGGIPSAMPARPRCPAGSRAARRCRRWTSGAPPGRVGETRGGRGAAEGAGEGRRAREGVWCGRGWRVHAWWGGGMAGCESGQRETGRGARE